MLELTMFSFVVVQMWTKIFLFLWIVGTVKYKSTPIPTDCANRVQRCPVKKDQWAQKKDLLKCTTSFGYVCLRDANGYLYESCMANFTILADSGDCPTLFACQDNNPYLGAHSTYYHCPEDVSGCPPRNHAEYSIYQLYKYPKCIESNFSEEMESTSQTSTTSMASKGSSDLNRLETKGVVIPLVITLVIVALLGCVIGYSVYSRKKKYDYSKGTSEDIESPSEDIVYSRKKKYDYSKGSSEDIEGPSEGFLLSRMEENDDSQIANVENGDPPEGDSQIANVENGGPPEGDLKSQELRCWIQLVNESVAEKVRILPLKENDTIEVDRICVPVSIVDENEIRTSGTTGKQTKSVITPEKLFYIKPGKPALFIFMLGDAGYGKTVQCQRITKSWCKAWKTENLQSKTQGNTEKELERSLKEFDFLFFVPLRDLNNKDSCIDDIVCNYYRRFDTSHQYLGDIRAVLKDERYRCLIILDGLDEWNISESMKGSLLHKGIPNCEGMPSCTFLITMRSWRFMEVDPLCRQGLFDKVVRLHGLDDEGIEELTTNMLCNYFDKERNSEEFLEQYESVRSKTSSSVLRSLMKIPLLAIFCILTWHENIETGHSLTTFYLSMIEALIKRSFKREQTGQNREYDTESSVPSILKNFFYVTNNMPYVSRLGEMAFNDLASRSATFVLSDVHLKKPEERETLAFFLKIGILSKRDTSGQIHEDNVRYSFLHKTIQEFLYSLNLVYNKSEERIVEYLCNEISDIEKALDLSTVLTFVSGLSPAVGCNISRHLAEISSVDKDIQRFREHFPTDTFYKVFHLFNLQLSCYREVRGWKSIKDFQKNGLVFSLSDVILLGNDMDKLTIQESADVLCYHANDIKSLCMKFISSDSDEGISNMELTEFLHKSDTLVALDIDGYDRGNCRLFDDPSKRLPCLHTLGLLNVAFADNILTDFLKKDESRRRIIALGLFYIKSADDLFVDFQYQFASVHRLVSARSGYVQKRKFRPSSEISERQMKGKTVKPLLKCILEVLPSYECLSTLCVSYMDSEDDRHELLRVLPKIKTLKNFGYDGTSIYPKPDYLYDNAVIKVLLQMEDLQMIILNEITLKENVLDFETLSSLEEVTLEVFKMNECAWCSFVKSLSNMKKLRKVILNDTNIDEGSYEKLKSFPSLDVIKDDSTEW